MRTTLYGEYRPDIHYSKFSVCGVPRDLSMKQYAMYVKKLTNNDLISAHNILERKINLTTDLKNQKSFPFVIFYQM